MLENFKSFTWKGSDENNFILKDISTSIKIYHNELFDRYSWDDYYIKDDDSFELISYNHYGTVNYWWVIMITNKLIDYSNDLPLSEDNLIKMACINNNIEYDKVTHSHMVALNKIKFYELDGIITHIGDINDFTYTNLFNTSEVKEEENDIPEDQLCKVEDVEEEVVFIDASKLGTPVSYLDYARRENDKKRIIKILNPIYINSLVEDLRGILNE